MAFTARLGTASSYLGNIELGVADIVAPVVSADGQTGREFFTGPPIPGAPWASARSFVVSAFAAPPSPPGEVPSSRFSPEVRIGPPMPGAPWFKAALARTPAPLNQPPVDMTISQKLIIRSRFAANPGVLVSGRRVERPGLGQQ